MHLAHGNANLECEDGSKVTRHRGRCGLSKFTFLQVTSRQGDYLERGCLSAGGGEGARDDAAVSRCSDVLAGLPAPLPPRASANPLMLPTHTMSP